MAHDERMNGTGTLLVCVTFFRAVSQLPGGVPGCIVLAAAPLDRGAKVVRQLLVGLVKIVERGGSARRRDFYSVKQQLES